MQSSTAMACRVLVMLVCLIAVPLAAIFGSSLSEVARALLGGGRAGGSGSARQSLAGSPLLGTASEMVGDLAGSPDASQEAAPARPASPGLVATAGVIQAGREVPSQAIPADRSPSLPRPAASAGSLAPDSRPVPSASSVPTPDLPPPVAAAPGDRRVAAIEQRLRQLGSTHCLLEPWGSRGQLFRFHCKAAIGGNPNWNRYFQATDPDPLRAMSKVLAQVEAWRARGG